jgi:hypothetical protein
MTRYARRRTLHAMSAEHNDTSGGSPRARPNVYRDLRVRNERRMAVARILEARRVQQVERVIRTSRQPRFGGPR